MTSFRGFLRIDSDIPGNQLFYYMIPSGIIPELTLGIFGGTLRVIFKEAFAKLLEEVLVESLQKFLVCFLDEFMETFLESSVRFVRFTGRIFGIDSERF